MKKKEKKIKIYQIALKEYELNHQVYSGLCVLYSSLQGAGKLSFSQCQILKEDIRLLRIETNNYNVHIFEPYDKEPRIKFLKEQIEKLKTNYAK